MGIGSPNGDDQAGWRVIDTLSSLDHAAVQLRKASVPHDLIDWLEDCDSLHIVDACDSEAELQRFDMATDRHAIPTRIRSCGSHQIGVASVIELAESLQLMPARVTLWAIPGKQFDANAEIGSDCMKHVQLCADFIQQELEHA